MEKMEKMEKMERQQPLPLPALSAQDWDALIHDFSSNHPHPSVSYHSLPLADLALHALSRRDLPPASKLAILHFLDQYFPSLITIPPFHFQPLIAALRSLLPSPDPSPLKDQLLITTTSLFVSLFHLHEDEDEDEDEDAPSSSSSYLQSLTELLLTLINRPNHGPDRQTRALACESLRQLEAAFPCLLSQLLGHVWLLAQAERTHAAQSYLLLLAQISRNVVLSGLLASTSSILSTSTPLTPFSVPQIALSHQTPLPMPPSSDVNLREIRRVLAFLLDRPRDLTPGAVSELTSILVDIADALQECVPAISALLKLNFSSLLSCHHPLLDHSILSLYHHFSDAFSQDDVSNVVCRLQLLASDTGQRLIFRLLAVHWLFGSTLLVRHASSPSSLPGFYPQVFDPLAVKAKKLDAISVIASERDEPACLLEDGLACVSSFRWLPGWSTETCLAFRAMHKLLITVMPHDASDSSPHNIFMRLPSIMESSTFIALENMLLKLSLEHHALVPVIATLISRLLQCETHSVVGDRFLQTLEKRLIPNLKAGYGLSSYFALLEKMVGNEVVSPKGVLELLKRHMVCLSEGHGPDTGYRSWSQGSRVLGICRVALRNHYGSQIFSPLSQLLAFTCHNFPDLEVRDNARIYLRMLACIPGKKLRQALSSGEEKSGLAAPLPASLSDVPSSQVIDLKQSSGIASYIHVERVTPPLVKQSWFLSVPASLFALSNGSASLHAAAASPSAPHNSDKIDSTTTTCQTDTLKVMDPKTAELLRVLRTHFKCIPDYRIMPAIKIRIPCILRFDSEPFTHAWGSKSSEEKPEPALYATKITFSSFSKYGQIPPCRVPFLLGESAKPELALVTLDQGYEERTDCSKICIELQPEDPMPGSIEISMKANTASGLVISGSLRAVTVGIEDMFLKAISPPDISDEWVPLYYSDLFDALWEACGSSENTNTGRETYSLKGGKGAVAINGTQSVKLLQVPADKLIDAVEKHLIKYVVRVAGAPLVRLIRQNGVIENVVWVEKDEDESVIDVDTFEDEVSAEKALVTYSREESEVNSERSLVSVGKSKSKSKSKSISMGTLCVLVFLPPRYHLLFLMEIGCNSTMVRMRTDHWPCLAYVDEYLEALF